MTSAPRRLRIAVLNRIFSPKAGGAERYSFALVQQLAARHEIHVFAQEMEHAADGPIPGVVYHRVSMPFRKPRWVNQLWFATATWWQTRARQDLNFDVVHSHENTWHGDVQTVHVLPVKHNLLAGRHGLKRALKWLSIATSPRLLVYLWLERQRYRPRLGRTVVVTSDTLRPIFSFSYPEAAGSVTVITPGIDLPPERSLEEQLAARKQLGLPAEGKCLLFVGNDMRKKGLATVVEALSDMSREEGAFSTPFLAVAGSLAQAEAFRLQAENSGLGPRVHFLGALGNMNAAYAAADCLVHPTLEDTFGMAVLEAMAHGLPVVVSSAQYCGVAGLLDDDINALILSDPRSSAGLASNLRRILSDADLSSRLGREARFLASRHQWGDAADRQEAVYQQVRDALRHA